MKKNKMRYLLIILLIFTVGCGNKLKINTKYDSIKLEVTNVMNAGCYEIDDDTYFTHNIQDKHIYEIDYKNNIEYVKTDHWIGYNLDEGQFISGDLGITYISSNEFTSEVFSTQYQNDLIKLFEYIDNSEKTNIVEKNGETVFTANFGENGNDVFEIIKKFGTINSNDKMKSLNVSVTVVDKNIINIVFNVVSTNDTSLIDNCYKVEWNLSDFNKVDIEIPTDMK